jgi:hypothetical protein
LSGEEIGFFKDPISLKPGDQAGRSIARLKAEAA